ncbi:MAG: S1 RNA-binding domain-containing protein [Spirochaetes bacterium]|jgi:small subunit ribosomal protein S1|nr:S1 RNA-binding domain-containing protein [Spirochaetota bacterium]
MENVNEKIDDGFTMESIANSAMDELQPNKLMQGEVVTIDSEFVYVNVGTKSDGRVRIQEFAEPPAVGDTIDIVLAERRLVDGMYMFSNTAAVREKGWRRLQDLRNSGQEYLTGAIAAVGEKGLTVDCDGISAFLPFSQAADLRSKKTAAPGEMYTFKIKSIDPKKRSVLVSRREYLDETREKFWAGIVDKYNVGDRITGKVTRFVEFGAFVDIGGVEGLLHKNDISWKRVYKKKNILHVGEEREFVILDIKKDEGKISLGLRQLVDDPWVSIGEKYKTGDTVEGRVVTLTGQGVFVEIEDGVEGFLSASEVSWTRKTVLIKDTFKKGQAVTVSILGIDGGERRLVLGMKQLANNPWDAIDERFPVGTTLKAPVRKVVSFGIFVEIEEGIDGLVHLSDMSWEDNVKDPAQLFKAGDEVEVKILEIKKKEMRISCGIKQLTRSPWQAVKEKFPPRSKVSGVVSGVVPFGLFVRLSEDLEGLVHISEVSRRKIENLEEKFKVGDQVSAVVLGVDVDKKRLSLSMKHFEVMSEKEELGKILNNSAPARITIGDMIRMKQG